MAANGRSDNTRAVAISPKVPVLPRDMKRLTLTGCTAWGALVDLVVFIGSFVFFGGAHGPAGPMFVLGVLNAPVRELVVRLWPPEARTNSDDVMLAFLVVLLNGALYGLLVGLLGRLW